MPGGLLANAGTYLVGSGKWFSARDLIGEQLSAIYEIRLIDWEIF
jgi:hypothetical protein